MPIHFDYPFRKINSEAEITGSTVETILFSPGGIAASIKMQESSLNLSCKSHFEHKLVPKFFLTKLYTAIFQ